jgi:glycosyltransferase involved in cell wall biosynthesis
MISEPKVTVIIPAYNEEQGLLKVISQLKSVNNGYEIVVVDDGSTDNTYNLAVGAGVKVIRHPYNKGYGAALKTGIRNANGDIVLLMDADGQHQPKDIENILSYIGEYDMVVGARTKNSKVSLLRRPGKKILSIVANYLAGMKIPDLNSGFRAIKKNVAMEFMHILPNTFSFTTTITLSCILSGYSVRYVPIHAPERIGTSKIKPFKDGLNFIILIIRTVVLFNPLKVFLPIAIILFIPGVLDLLIELIFYFNVSSASILLIVTSVLIFFFGILADQISSIRRLNYGDYRI